MKTTDFRLIDDKVANSCYSQLVSFLMDQKNIAISLGTATSLGFTLLANNGGITLPMITGAGLFATGSSVVKAIHDTRKFANEYNRELIRETPEYAECLELYESVIVDIATLFRYLRLKDSMDIGNFYQEMLYHGYFSSPGKFAYHKYGIDKGICPELYGARVTTGKGVCRHIAMNLKDIYEAMGFTASYLSVGGTNCSFINELMSRIFPREIRHAVVCVKDSYGKYIVDPTWEKVALFENHDAFARIVGDNRGDRKYVVGYTTLINRRKIINYDSYVGLRKSKNASFTDKEVDESAYYAKELYISNLNYIREFYDYIKDKLDRISYLEQLISRCRDLEDKGSSKHLKHK